MADKSAYLVVGGDSLVGGGVVSALEQRGHRTFASTRRRDTLDPKRVYLDFESDAPFRAPSEAGYAFLIAAATNYDRCETDPLAKVINVELIPRAVASLLEQGLFVTFVSTNSVFGGEQPWPHEDGTHAPGIAYAQQKSDGEKVVLDAAAKLGALDRLNIVRLTKIMNAGVSPVPAWIAAWKKNQPIQPFADLIFAPISVKFVGNALATIGEKRVCRQSAFVRRRQCQLHRIRSGPGGAARCQQRLDPSDHGYRKRRAHCVQAAFQWPRHDQNH